MANWLEGTKVVRRLPPPPPASGGNLSVVIESKLTVLYIFLGLIAAFAIGWSSDNSRVAQHKAISAGSVIVFLPSCAPMFIGDPVGRNFAAEQFFWSLPFYAAWFIACPATVALAKYVRDQS